MKVCLAAIDSSRHMGEQLFTIPYMLSSFFYAEKMEDWIIPVFKHAEFFMLDSGAFSFMTGSGSADFDTYLIRYIEFIKKYNFDFFFELDVDSVVGYKKVKEMRKRLEQETGKQCIPVWHVSRGMREYINLCKEYSYIAIGGLVTKEIHQKDFMKLQTLIDIANKCECKVHGLGFTYLKYLPVIKFDSVDSSTWTAGRRYGSIYQFNGKSLITHKRKDARVENSADADANNLREWIKFQRYADIYY